VILEYPIEVRQRLQRYLRLSERHRGTGRAVEHPPFHGRRYSGFVLDNDDFRSAALLAVVASDMPTIKRMPAVMDLDFFPDMGRMSGRWQSFARIVYSRVMPAAAGLGRRSQLSFKRPK
jgi:hypothetical protein